MSDPEAPEDPPTDEPPTEEPPADEPPVIEEAAPAARPVLIEVKDLFKSFGSVEVLRGVSFEVRAGETVCILGGSGGGKSTLLKTMIRAHPATSGVIEIDGDDIAQAEGAALDAIRRKFGVMFQLGALLNSLSVAENVALPLEYHTELDADTRELMVTLKLQQVDMLHAQDRLPSEISGGMQKRAAVARALALDPRILFYDEPSAGLDPIATTRIDNLINALKESMGMTNIVVTHVMESVERIADRIIFLKQGQVHFDGTLEAFKASDDHDIQQFLAAEVEEADGKAEEAFFSQLLGTEEQTEHEGHPLLGWLGRTAIDAGRAGLALLVVMGGIAQLLLQAGASMVREPLKGGRNLRRMRALTAPLLEEIGIKSLAIVVLVSALMGAILLFQTGGVLEDYGQIEQAPTMVAYSIVRELGPLMTAFILAARVGASFTAVTAAMKLNEEILALRTMAIDPVTYLVTPRLLGMVVMLPCLTVLSYFAGILGGALVAGLKYDLAFGYYVSQTLDSLGNTDLLFGLFKALMFALLTSGICCYYGMNTTGGPMGLGRYIRRAVVISMVVIVIADAILTAFFITYMPLMQSFLG